MKKHLRRVLTLALLVMLAVSVFMAARQQAQYQENELSRTAAAQLAKFHPPELPRKSGGTSSAQPETSAPTPEEPDPLATALETMDIPALQAANSDVRGWIYIPDTSLSYPLLQGRNNDFYLYRSWDKSRNNCGSIFLDYRCSKDFQDFNTLIYGHRMRNDSMFGTLKYYREQDFWQDHPTVYLVDSTGVRLYDVFAAWEPSVTSVVYSLDYGSEKKRQEFLDTCLAESQLDTGIVPTPEDRIITLSTCTGNGHATRWVVQAVLRPEEQG